MYSRSRLRKRSSQTWNSLLDFLSQKKVMGTLTFLPVLLLVIFVYLLPIVWVVAGSLHAISAFSPEWEWIGIANYTELLTSPSFHDALWLSTFFAAVSVGIQLITGVGLALLVNRSFKYKYFVRTIVMLPYLVPTVVVGFVTLWMANSQYGVINQLLARAGLIENYIPWFGNADLALIAVIVTGSWKFTIFVTIMVLARLQSIPDDYYEAAETCGASMYNKFVDITLPNIKSVLFIVLLLRGIFMFNKFDIIWVTTRGGPSELTTTAPVYAYKRGFMAGELGQAAAVSVILFFILAITATVYFVVFSPSKEVSVK